MGDAFRKVNLFDHIDQNCNCIDSLIFKAKTCKQQYVTKLSVRQSAVSNQPHIEAPIMCVIYINSNIKLWR